MKNAAPELDVAGAIDRHFATMDPAIRFRVMQMADLLGEAATAGLRGTLPDCILGMPMALLDEDKVNMTMDILRPAPMSNEGSGVQFQGGGVGGPGDRYWTTINANSTEAGAKNDFSMINFLPILDCIETETDFPLGFFAEIYETGTPICTIRADLADASIEQYRRICKEAGVYPKDIMYGNFDADTRGFLLMGKSATLQPYVSQLVEVRRDSSAAYLEVFPSLGHQEIDEVRFPHIQRLIKWRDYMNAKFGFSFAAHYAVNLYGYLDSGGYNREWDNNEQLFMGRAMAARAVETGQDMESVQLKGVMPLVSPRRYIIELMNGQHMGYGNLRVPADGQRVHVDPPVLEDLSKKRFKQEVIYEVGRICDRGLKRFVAEYEQQHPGCAKAAALDHAFERIEELIKEEGDTKDAPTLPDMKKAILRGLADFADHVEELKEDAG